MIMLLMNLPITADGLLEKNCLILIRIVRSEQQIERKPSILNCPRLVQGHKDHKVINKMFVIPSLHVIC